MNELNLMVNESKDGHNFKVYKWDNSEEWREEIIRNIGSKVREVYLGYSELKEIVEDEKDELGFELSEVEKHLRNLLNDTIPSEDDGGIVSTPRSDFPEIFASLCLESLFDTNIPVDLIEKKDTLDQPGRGVDILGYEEIAGHLHLLLCEVKGSSEDRNPPLVITGKDDSLDEQLQEFVLNKDKIEKNIMLIYRKSKEQSDKKKLAELLLRFQESPNDTKIILCPFLVRELEKYGDEDYKHFKNNSKDYEPYKLRFLAVCIDDNITKLSEDIYEFARGSEDI